MRVRFNYTSIGDTLGLTAVAEIYYDKFKRPLEIVTHLPELFYNNPYVICSNIFNSLPTDVVLEPCKNYDCNIVNNFVRQLGLDFNNEKPRIYLSIEEIFRAETFFSNYPTKKHKAVICLNAARGCDDFRSIRYDVISPFLERVKNELNCDLFLVGKKEIPLNDKCNVFTNQIYDISLRDCFGIISQCNLYIGVDTGLFHASAGLDVPQLVFFRNAGCSNNSYSDTYYDNSKIKCSGVCLLAGAQCDKSNRCMDNFNLERYFSLAGKLLK